MVFSLSFIISINIYYPSVTLLGLKQKFNNFNEAMEMILSSEMPSEEDLEDEKYIPVIIIVSWIFIKKPPIYMV